MNQLARFQIALNGAIFVSPFFAQSQRPIIQKFVAAYKAKYQLEPDFLAAQAFDGATLIQAAVRRGSAEQTTFERALMEIGQYEGLTGKMEILNTGEINRSYPLLEFKDGGVSELSLDGSTSEYVYRGNEQIDPSAAQAGAPQVHN